MTKYFYFLLVLSPRPLLVNLVNENRSLYALNLTWLPSKETAAGIDFFLHYVSSMGIY